MFYFNSPHLPHLPNLPQFSNFPYHYLSYSGFHYLFPSNFILHYYFLHNFQFFIISTICKGKRGNLIIISIYNLIISRWVGGKLHHYFTHYENNHSYFHLHMASWGYCHNYFPHHQKKHSYFNHHMVSRGHYHNYSPLCHYL